MSWHGYAGWTGGVELDTFGHRHWLRDNLPSLATVYVAALNAAQIAEPAQPPPARIAAAIARLRARGVLVGNRRDLLAWLADGVDAGFTLTAPPMATRVFATGWPAGDGPYVPAKHLAEAVADHLNNLLPPVPAVALTNLADAQLIDRLDLFAPDGIEDELRRPLLRLLDERPELADRLGRPQLAAFAALVWRDGVAKQYAREAGGEVVVVAPAPYEGESLIAVDLPELAASRAVVAAEIACLGFTHELYRIEHKLADDQRVREARRHAAAAGLTGDDVRRAGTAARRGPVALPVVEDRASSYREAVEAGHLPAARPKAGPEAVVRGYERSP
ncbi:hypothetical protein [Fodinicola acaciae]|uniref:hypothetical protein n=1 Tax=Fodinicola acaciae TaxID=2681555 RepID=UPI0013D40BC3|nr:hypothetical protein [Fodinicola acaciae]